MRSDSSRTRTRFPVYSALVWSKAYLRRLSSEHGPMSGSSSVCRASPGIKPRSFVRIQSGPLVSGLILLLLCRERRDFSLVNRRSSTRKPCVSFRPLIEANASSTRKALLLKNVGKRGKRIMHILSKIMRKNKIFLSCRQNIREINSVAFVFSKKKFGKKL